MAVKLFDQLEALHNGMSVEWLIDKLDIQEVPSYNKKKKFIWNPINRVTKQVEIEHPHYGKIVTMISEDTLDRIWISIDDFPECNYREHKNRFLAGKDELVELDIQSNARFIV